MSRTTKVQFHEALDRAATVAVISNRAAGVAAAVLLALVALRPLLRQAPPVWWLLGVAAGLGAGGLLAPRWLAPVAMAWTALGNVLARVMTPVIMGIVFYGVVTPIGWLMRLFRKDPLCLQWDPKADSYWIPRDPPGPSPETMVNQF